MRNLHETLNFKAIYTQKTKKWTLTQSSWANLCLCDFYQYSFNLRDIYWGFVILCLPIKCKLWQLQLNRLKSCCLQQNLLNTSQQTCPINRLQFRQTPSAKTQTGSQGYWIMHGVPLRFCSLIPALLPKLNASTPNLLVMVSSWRLVLVEWTNYLKRND